MPLAAGLALMVVGMLGLGYVASYSKGEVGVATGAQQVVAVRPDYVSIDPKDRELEALQAENGIEEAQSLRSGPRSDEQAAEEKVDVSEQAGEDDVLPVDDEELLNETSGLAGRLRWLPYQGGNAKLDLPKSSRILENQCMSLYVFRRYISESR